MKRIAIIAGARPNFMKVAPLVRAFHKQGVKPTLIHTGQHKGAMADQFFKEFGLKPDHLLPPPIFTSLKKLLKELKPELVLVVGDVDSTFYGALAAKQNGLLLGHVEAGLRSFDMQMPEEVNRIVVDDLSDFLFVSEESGMVNLKKEHVKGKCFLVGNVMIDNLQREVLVTLHRPSNVDNKQRLTEIIRALNKLDRNLVWPMHPRTEKNLRQFRINTGRIKIIPPVGHEQLIQMIKNAEFVITDSGGIQEEAAYLGRVTYTMRDNTERPATIEHGLNQLVTPKNLPSKVRNIPFWDGHAAERIVKIILRG